LWQSTPDKDVVGWHRYLQPAGSNAARIEHARQTFKMGAKHSTIGKRIPAVYEFALVHPARPDTRIKVYVGKTIDLHRRRTDYLNLNSNEGTRMWPFFSHALRHGCEIWRRFVYLPAPPGALRKHSEGDRAVSQIETRLLSYFDYTFNREANPPKRKIHLEPRVWCCCFPNGVYVVKERTYKDPDKDTRSATH
jgi:hypothetical protein